MSKVIIRVIYCVSAMVGLLALVQGSSHPNLPFLSDSLAPDFAADHPQPCGSPASVARQQEDSEDTRRGTLLEPVTRD